MVRSTPHALSTCALSTRAISPRALSSHVLSPYRLRNILKSQVSQVDFFNWSLSKTIFVKSVIKETGLDPELFI